MYWQGMPFGGATILRHDPAMLVHTVRSAARAVSQDCPADDDGHDAEYHVECDSHEASTPSLLDSGPHGPLQLSEYEIQREHRVMLNTQLLLDLGIASSCLILPPAIPLSTRRQRLSSALLDCFCNLASGRRQRDSRMSWPLGRSAPSLPCPNSVPIATVPATIAPRFSLCASICSG